VEASTDEGSKADRAPTPPHPFVDFLPGFGRFERAASVSAGASAAGPELLRLRFAPAVVRPPPSVHCLALLPEGRTLSISFPRLLVLFRPPAAAADALVPDFERLFLWPSRSAGAAMSASVYETCTRDPSRGSIASCTPVPNTSFGMRWHLWYAVLA
jgi:hypothetical protein